MQKATTKEMIYTNILNSQKLRAVKLQKDQMENFRLKVLKDRLRQTMLEARKSEY